MLNLNDDVFFAEDKTPTANDPLTDLPPTAEASDQPDEDLSASLSESADANRVAEPDGSADASECSEEPDEAGEDFPEPTVAELLIELNEVKAQLEALETFNRNQTRILNELTDFAALFPEVAVDEIPEEVWAAVRQGNALSAAFALYEKKRAADERRVANINAKNASNSPGAAGINTASEYFTPDDVRKMSRAEVHLNYSKIKESMKKWM